MRTISLFLLLTIGSVENTHGPFARPERGGGHSVAAARSGVLLAWSENDATGRARVHVALLDSSARRISPVTAIPALTPGRDAIVPAVSTDGTSFFVVWEEVLGKQQTVGIAVDASGLPIGTPKALGTETPIADNVYDPARVTWLGDAYAVRSDSTAPMRVSRDGTPLGAMAGAFPIAVAADGTRASAELRIASAGFPGLGGLPIPSQYSVVWTAGTRNGSDVVGPQPPSTPVVAAAGDDFAIVWTAQDAVFYRMASGARYSIHANVDSSARPRVACSATRCVVAYATRSGDVHGFTFAPGQPYAPQLFVAAASERDEREPALLLLSDSRAVITYRSGGSDERLGTRSLKFGATKHRAVR